MDTNKLLSLQTLEDIKNYIDGNMGAFKVYQIDIPAPLASGRGSDISEYGIQVTRALNECIAIGKLPVIKSKNYYGLIFPDFTIKTLRDITYTKYEFVSPLCIVKSTSGVATRIGVANIYFKFAAHDETGLTYKSDMSGAGQCWWHSTHTTAVLPINNEYKFTPTKDYHPATKKYVDDAVVASAGSGSSFDPTKYLAIDNTTEYTPTSNYHPATKKYVDDNKVSSNEITAILDEYGTKQNLKVGDDLTGKTISYAFPDNIEDNIAEGEQIIISTSTEYGDHHVILVSSNILKYRYIDTEGSPYTQNLCTISNGATGDISYNFRFTIQDIDTSNYLYPYLFFKEDPLLSRIETLETNSAKETSKLTIRLDINGPSDWKVGTDNIEINYTNKDGRFVSEKWYPTDITASGEDKIINIAKGTVFTITSTYNMTNLTKYGECTNVQPLYKNTSSTEVTCFIYKDGKVRFWDGERT